MKVVFRFGVKKGDGDGFIIHGGRLTTVNSKQDLTDFAERIYAEIKEDFSSPPDRPRRQIGFCPSQAK
jgi:hypothetical protein